MGAVEAGTRPVGFFPANTWDLHDMHGNVRERCLDLGNLVSNNLAALPAAAVSDPLGASGTHRVLRGGAWDLNASQARSARRLNEPAAGLADKSIGFRVSAPMPANLP